MSRPEAVILNPSTEVRHFSGTAAALPTGTVVDFGTKLAAGELSERVRLKNNGGGAIELHLEMASGDDYATDAPDPSLGGLEVAAGESVELSVKRRQVVVSGSGEAFDLIVFRS